ncbi:MAG: TonB-dependent siderophore receptor [Aquabacterium sp.]
MPYANPSLSARQRLRLNAIVSACILAWTASSALAQPVATAPAVERTYALPAQPLGQALNDLARQAGMAITADAGLVAGKQAPAVSGRLTTQQALERLLAGSGLTATVQGNAIVVRAAAGPGEALLPAVTITAGARASTARGNEAGTEYVSPVVDAGILGTRATLDTPFSIQSYTRDVIEEQQSRTLTEALRNDASVRNLQNAGGYASAANIRGFDTSGASWDGLAGGFAAGYQDFPLEFVDAVEVLKGPGAVLFGSSNLYSPVGTVNFVPKRAPASRNTVIRKVMVGVQTGGAVNVSADLGGRFGERSAFGYRVNVLARNGRLAVDDVKLNESGLLASLDWRASPNLTFTADLGTVRSEKKGYTDTYGLGSDTRVPAPPKGRINASMPWAYWSANRDFALVKADWKLNDAWRLELASTQTRMQFDYLSAGFITIGDQQGNGTLVTGVAKPLTQDAATYKATLMGNLVTGPIQHDLALSLSRDADKGTYTPGLDYGSFATNIYKPQYAPRPVPVATGTGAITWGDTTIDTARIVDAMTLGDMTVIAGIGHVTLKDRIGPYDKSKVTPLAAALYKLAPSLSVYASYAEGLEKGGTAPLSAANGAEVLAPKVSKQAELGLKKDWNAMLLSGAVFQIDRALEYTDPSSNRFVQNGVQRHAGVELSASGPVAPGFNVIASALIMRPTVKNDLVDGKDATGVPKQSLSLFASYRMPAYSPLAVFAGMQYKSSQWFDLANTQKIDSYAVFDLGATLDMKAAFGVAGRLRLAVDNVANKAYWSSVSYGCCLAKGEPRTVKLMASFDLR